MIYSFLSTTSNHITYISILLLYYWTSIYFFTLFLSYISINKHCIPISYFTLYNMKGRSVMLMILRLLETYWKPKVVSTEIFPLLFSRNILRNNNTDKIVVQRCSLFNKHRLLTIERMLRYTLVNTQYTAYF